MKGYTHLTAAQRTAIVASYQRTQSTVLTAQELGLPRKRVTACVKRAGLPLTWAKDSACYRHTEQVRAWAAEGLALSEIARRIGTKHQTVAKFLRERNIPYQRFERKGPNNPAWRGGRQVDKTGYVLVWQPEHPEANRHGCVREHRLVMERKLGRPLHPGEVVHHLDGNKANNDPSNLEVFASNGEHLAQTRKGQAPQISPEGWERIRESTRQVNMRRRIASRAASARGGQPS